MFEQEISIDLEKKTVQEIYANVFRQFEEIAKNLYDHPYVFLSSKDKQYVEERTTVLLGYSNTILFKTELLNISKQEDPTGAYPNEFIFTFSPDQIELSYTEALPPRQQRLMIAVEEIATKEELLSKLRPLVEKINLLLMYFKNKKQP